MVPPMARTVALGLTIVLCACGEGSVTQPVEAANGHVLSVNEIANAAEKSVTVCHVDMGKNGYKLTRVGASSVASHMAHGDIIPGGPLGNDCTISSYFLDTRATTESQLHGGQGGFEFVDPCPAGAVGVGVSGSVAT